MAHGRRLPSGDGPPTTARFLQLVSTGAEDWAVRKLAGLACNAAARRAAIARYAGQLELAAEARPADRERVDGLTVLLDLVIFLHVSRGTTDIAAARDKATACAVHRGEGGDHVGDALAACLAADLRALGLAPGDLA